MSAYGPGKTAPQIYQDFLLFDPIRGRPNLLIDYPTRVGEKPPLAASLGSCKHDYTTKVAQSILPPLDLRPDGSTHHKLAVICKKCRIHADIDINYAACINPCPNSDYPLHHFQRLPHDDLITAERIRYAWQCSAPQCKATLLISYRLSKITNEEKKLLTDPDNLKARYQEVLERDPTREGVREATPMEALSRLRKYIKDSLNPAHDKRSFPANNKRFMEAYGYMGQDCAGILKRLGFAYSESSWSLPNPAPLENRLQADGSSLRELLEDVSYELASWMYATASETGLSNPAGAEGWHSAERDVERTLAAQGYLRHVSSRRGAPNEELQYFASLGALPDFSDSLIAFVYDRQILCDPEDLPYYFECLQVISESRVTESLQMKVATLQSQDLVSRRDISAAYRHLGIDISSSQTLSDDRILEIFQARLVDLGPSAAEDARQALNRIGTARQSQRLLRTSHQSIDTYDDALSWFGNGVDANTPDDGIITIYTLRVNDHPRDKEIADKALSVIAKTRQSNYISNFLLTGNMESDTMSVDEALRHLNIEQRLEELDPTMLPILFESAESDRPGELTRKAIATIQQALANMNQTVKHSPDAWPVGLTSHGNTCYLNSLLQYYFSIKPLRDIVLNYDDYKLDTAPYENSPGSKKKERVGLLEIDLVEIKGGQRFAEDLRNLFERMIKDPGTAVRPEEDLVCRAFLPAKDYALLSSDIQEQAANEKPGPEEAVEESLIDFTPASNASSTTLQASVNGEDTDVAMKDAGLPPTPPASPGQRPAASFEEPDHAPPLTPRRLTFTKNEALEKAQENAKKQQDVYEVHDGAIVRLRSGMTPQGVTERQEQIDAITDLFTIEMVETTVTNGVAGKSKPLIDFTVQLNVPSEPVGIYSALDGFFDLQPQAEDPEIESFRSIHNLPPVLQISIPRIGHNGKESYKSLECVQLEDELFVDRYMNNDEILPVRRSCWAWRKQLRALQAEKREIAQNADGLDGPTSLTETANFLESISETDKLLEEVGIESIDVNGSLSTTLKAQAEKQAERVSALDTEINALQTHLNGQFNNMKTLKYRLAAVFIHRGSAGAGHYWIYIHDFANKIWRSYNDERVEEHTNLEDIFEAKIWSQGTPTYVAYVKDEVKEQYIQPVCRALDKASSPQAQQVQEMVQSKDVHMASDNQDVASGLVNEIGTAEWGGDRHENW
ncbi:Hypothetical protein R9X50_00081800 [Acrodontium crateriforme]|uniref:ubiquitinyl hydrolase 1 n=1 Tax=Acrodontium crateriforme TaxID=150365 RepID=A0AAQ3R7J3_9PEZI|nr:Hypothetical protein R9X50_00081800 [Acrodontium crateriforme]